MKKTSLDCDIAIQEVAQRYELTPRLQALLGINPLDDSRSEFTGSLFEENLQSLNMALSILKPSKICSNDHRSIDPHDPTEHDGNQRDQGIRKDRPTWTIVTSIPYDDGHRWRKYGQKMISSSKFPRCYYRCTYRDEQGCLATKQVQQKDYGDPPSFLVTYINKHTCSSTLMAPHFVIDPSQSEPLISLLLDSNARGSINEHHAFLSPLPTMIQDCDGRTPYWQDDTTSSSNQRPMSLNSASQGSMEVAETTFSALSSFDDTSSIACPMRGSHSSDVDYMMMDSMEIEFDGEELIF